MSTYYYIGMFLFTMNNELVEQLTYNLWEKVRSCNRPVPYKVKQTIEHT